MDFFANIGQWFANLWQSDFFQAIADLWNDSGIARLCNFEAGGWKNLIMIGIACVLLYLAIKKQFEPLLLLPIAFGMLLVNLPLGGVMDPQRNSVVPFSQEEFVQYMEGTYEQVYPVMENTMGEVPLEYVSQLNPQLYVDANGGEHYYIQYQGTFCVV